MKFQVGDFVVVKDPTPYLGDGNFTNALFFNDRMRVFIGRIFRVSEIQNNITYKLEYIDESDRLEGIHDVITRWSWNEKWLAPTDWCVSDDIDYDNLQDIMLMITW